MDSDLAKKTCTIGWTEMLKAFIAASLLASVLGLSFGCRTDEAQGNPNSQSSTLTTTGEWATHPHHYTLRAGGPQCVIGITNSPASNLASICLATLGDDGAIFRLTNGETHAILLWNVRVQVPSTGRGTDGFGWDTVYDDYPTPTTDFNFSHYPPGAVGEFRVRPPQGTTWRVCILYSTDWTDTGKTYWGNFEVISGELSQPITMDEIAPSRAQLGPGWTSDHTVVLVDQLRPTEEVSNEGKGWLQAAHNVVGKRNCEAHAVLRYEYGSGSCLVWIKRFEGKGDIGDDWGRDKETKPSLDKLPKVGDEVRFYQRDGMHNDIAFRRANYLFDVEGMSVPIAKLKQLAEMLDRNLLQAQKAAPL